YNTTALGYNAVAGGSNLMAFGNSSVTAWVFGRTTTSGSYALQVGSGSGNGNGAYLTNGGTWTNASDRNKKENFTFLSSKVILDKICALPVTQWNYKGSKKSNTHIGPMSQDFY